MKPGMIINNKYQLIDLIDENEKQYIFKAIMLRNEQPCAIKIVKNKWLKDERVVSKMIKEIENIATLRHKNLVKIIDVDLYNDIFYIAEEWVNGKRLDYYINKENLLSPEKAILIVKKIAYLLEYAMKNGIKYRSLKISNIMISDNFDVKILSFNLPRRFGIYGKKLSKNRGTDPDIFFLGVLLYSLLTGVFPIKKRDFIITDIKLMKYLEIDSDWKLDNLNLSEAVKNTLEELIWKSVTRETNSRISGFYDFFTYIDRTFEYLNKERGDTTAWEVIETIKPSKEEFWRESDKTVNHDTKYSGTLSYALFIAALLLAVYWLI